MMRLDYPDLSTPDIPYLARLLFLGLEDMPMAYLYREITTETAKALAPTEQENTPLQSLARAGRAHQRSRRPTLLSAVIKDLWDAFNASIASNASIL